MSDYERRMELLNQMKGNHTYQSFPITYNHDPKPEQKSTLGLRVMICILGFICYVFLDYGNVKISNISTRTVLNQIEKQVSIQQMLEL